MSNDGTVIYPGEYLMEVEFDRPVTQELLRRALGGMGFQRVVFDEPLFGAGGPLPTLKAARIGAGLFSAAPAVRKTGFAFLPPKAVVSKPAAAPAKVPGMYANAPAMVAAKAPLKVFSATPTASKVVVTAPVSPVQIQTLLNQSGLGLPALVPDGILGAKSLAAVKAFQTSHGLAADGIVGPATLAALQAAAGPGISRTVQTTDATSAKADAIVDTSFVPSATKVSQLQSAVADVINAPAVNPAATTVQAASPAYSVSATPAAPPGPVSAAVSALPPPAFTPWTPPAPGGGGGGGGGDAQPDTSADDAELARLQAAADAEQAAADAAQAAPPPAPAYTPMEPDAGDMVAQAEASVDQAAAEADASMDGPPPEPDADEEPRHHRRHHRHHEEGGDEEERWARRQERQEAQDEVSGDEAPFRFRFIAQIASPLRLCDRPGCTWRFVRKLSVDAYGTVGFQVLPHVLRTGGKYEVRFLSRDKSALSKGDVAQGLRAMGFAPYKLVALQRNIRLPQRAASLTLWLGVGQWRGPDTVTTREDPFCFETVEEVQS